MNDSTAVIVNLTEQTWTLHRGYGTFVVRGIASDEDARQPEIAHSGNSSRGGVPPADSRDARGVHAAPSCEIPASARPYALTRVVGRNALMDLGDKRSIDVPISAAEVAADLCHEINSDGGEDSNFGVFVAAGDVPTEEELAAGRARLETFYRRLVVAADREWERSHSYLFINDVERRAAQYLGVEKEWYYQVRETTDCPACGEKLKPGVAVCKTCGAILDREKAASLGLGLASFATPPSSVGALSSAQQSATQVGVPLTVATTKSSLPTTPRR